MHISMCTYLHNKVASIEIFYDATTYMARQQDVDYYGVINLYFACTGQQ